MFLLYAILPFAENYSQPTPEILQICTQDPQINGFEWFDHPAGCTGILPLCTIS
jgi:hypothetical protein